MVLCVWYNVVWLGDICVVDLVICFVVEIDCIVGNIFVKYVCGLVDGDVVELIVVVEELVGIGMVVVVVDVIKVVVCLGL